MKNYLNKLPISYKRNILCIIDYVSHPELTLREALMRLFCEYNYSLEGNSNNPFYKHHWGITTYVEDKIMPDIYGRYFMWIKNLSTQHNLTEPVDINGMTYLQAEHKVNTVINEDIVEILEKKVFNMFLDTFCNITVNVVNKVWIDTELIAKLNPRQRALLNKLSKKAVEDIRVVVLERGKDAQNMVTIYKVIKDYYKVHIDVEIGENVPLDIISEIRNLAIKGLMKERKESKTLITPKNIFELNRSGKLPKEHNE